MKKFYLCLIILVILISGCTQLIKEEEKIPEKKEAVVSQLDEKVISSLISKLNSDVASYEGSYKKEHEFQSWAGHSGAMDYNEESNISIEVVNGEIINYTIRHTKEGSPIINENFYAYYNKSKNDLCFTGAVTEIPCKPIILPKITHFMQGCKVEIEDSEAYCTEENKPRKSIKSWRELNYITQIPALKLNLLKGYASYIFWNQEWRQPESFCYYLVKDENEELWALKCEHQSIELKPIINISQQYRCDQSGNLCSCKVLNSAEQVEELCYINVPNNLDLEIKKEIINYLKNIKIISISKENNCYFFSYDNLEHSFCFDEKNLITSAQWGSNISTSTGIGIDIYRIERV